MRLFMNVNSFIHSFSDQVWVVYTALNYKMNRISFLKTEFERCEICLTVDYTCWTCFYLLRWLSKITGFCHFPEKLPVFLSSLKNISTEKFNYWALVSKSNTFRHSCVLWHLSWRETIFKAETNVTQEKSNSKGFFWNCKKNGVQ